MVARIAEQHHGLQRVHHRWEDRSESVFTVETLDEPFFGAACGRLTHRLRNERIDQARAAIEKEESPCQRPVAVRWQPEVVTLLLRGCREQLADVHVARVFRTRLISA